MYWPISAPRVYAATSSTALNKRVLRFDETNEGNGSLLTASSTPSDKPLIDEQLSGLLTPTTPNTPGINPIEHEAQRRLSAKNLEALDDADVEDGTEDALYQAQRRAIIGIRSTRSGQLFAVITLTSMTIWQTKVSHISAIYGER